MNIIETREYGNTTVRFCDDCCRNVDERQIEEILKSISDKALLHLQAKTA